MGRYSVKRYKVKRRTRDLDLIYNDLGSVESITKLKNQPIDEYKVGLGQFYCIHCAKYFENETAIQSHYKTKVHKRRVKEINQRPYTPLESEAAAGTNLNKFLESVEKHKARKAEEAVHKEELVTLINTNNPKEIGIIEAKNLEEGEVVME